MYYTKMTSDAPGALSIFHVYGDDDALARGVDARVRGRRSTASASALAVGELRYGWLFDADGGEAVDEVMLARPGEGMRVLMTHGGGAVAEAVRDFFRRAHIAGQAAPGNAPEAVDLLWQPLLSHCLTEPQAASVLAWLAGGPEPSAGLLATHRVVLAGPPNAGKSSLLNRLSGYERAFVHAEAGATRDVVDELVDIGGYAVWVGDLPGFSRLAPANEIETEARRRAEERLRLCEAVWFVADGSLPWEGETAAAASAVATALAASAVASKTVPDVLVVVNKQDLPPAWDGEPWREFFPAASAVRVCSLAAGDAGTIFAGVAHARWG